MAQTQKTFDKQLDAVIRIILDKVIAIKGQVNGMDDVKRDAFLINRLPSLILALEKSGYQGIYEQELKDVSTSLAQYHKLSGIPFAFATVDKDTLKALKP